MATCPLRPAANPTDVKTSSRHFWRRYLRFSLRALLVFVLLIGGWLGWIIHGARVQRDAVTALEQAGHWCYFDWEWNDGHQIRSKPWPPIWLVGWIGPHYFGRVTCVKVFNPKDGHQPDADLALIRHLYWLEELDLSRQA